MMKKLIAMICTVAMAVSVLAACGSSTAASAAAETKQETSSGSMESEAAGNTEAAAESASAAAGTADAAGETTVQAAETTEAPLKLVDGAMNIAALKGPTAMGMVGFMDGADSGKITDRKYNFQIAATPDAITPLLVQGKLDIAAVPANLASVLYNNTKGNIQVLAINTLGVIYIVENGDSIHSVQDLKGKTIYASGKGATPEYALNYILSGNGIDPAKDVTIEWKSEHAECLNALLSKENSIAMLPQPFVTTAELKSSRIRVAVDFTKEWENLQKKTNGTSALLTGVVVVRRDYAEKNPDAVKAFMDHYKESVDFVNANTDAAAELIGKYNIVKTEVAKKAIPSCNITFIEGTEMKNKLSGYLSVLKDQNPKAIGGTLPGDDFYYTR